MQMVVFEVLAIDRLKCPETDMQSDFGQGGAGISDAVQNLAGKVQAGSGGGNGAALAREDGLVTVAIRESVLALDVRRQGHVTETVQCGVDVFVAEEADRPFAAFALSDDFDREVIELNDRARSEFAPGPNQSAPFALVFRNRFKKQDLGFASQQARRQHAGVVQDDAIAFAQEGWELAELPVFESLLGAMNHEHPRAVAFGGRLLGDQLLGQFVIEIRKPH